MSKIIIGDYLYLELAKLAEQNGMRASELGREILTQFVNANSTEPQKKLMPITRLEQIKQNEKQVRDGQYRPFRANHVRI